MLDDRLLAGVGPFAQSSCFAQNSERSVLPMEMCFLDTNTPQLLCSSTHPLILVVLASKYVP